MRWWQFRRRDADLERELLADLELEEEEQRERGLSQEDAAYAAMRALGNTMLIRERTHEAWGWAPFERLWQDVQYGLRQFVRNPGFALVAIVTLAIGIGVNTTLFSAFSAILLRKPPVKYPDSLCAVSSTILHRNNLIRASAPDFKSWQRQNHVFQQMAAVEVGRPFTLTGKFEPESLQGDRVTTGFFSVIGIKLILGRPFLSSEDKPGKNHEVILSTALWRQHFAANPDAIGQNLEIDGKPYKIIGVMPPFSGLSPWAHPQLWTPLVFSPQDLSPSARRNHYINLVLGRLKSGVTVEQAQEEMDSIAGHLARRYPSTNKNWGVQVLTLQARNIRNEGVRNALLLIMIAVGLVLLIACANVGGLLLTRAACRTHEVAVRSALGASRGRILRQMLTESLLIGSAGGLAGLLLSIGGIRLLKAGFQFNAFGRRLAAGFRIDLPTLLFMIAITLLTTIVFGLLPALRSSNASPNGVLSQTGRIASQGAAASRLRKLLVVGEIVTAMILLTAAGVIMRQIVRELTETNGFNPNHLLVANLNASSPQYKMQQKRVAFYSQTLQNIRNLPEVTDAAVDSCIPMHCFFRLPFHLVANAAQSSLSRLSASFSVVGPGYFRTMQIPLLRGRAFSDDDGVQAPVVAVVNRQFAQRFFPHQDVIGKQIEVRDGNHKKALIVGIVGNVNKYVGQLHPQPQIYESYLQIPVIAFSRMSLVVRSPLPAAKLSPLLRHAVWSVDKAQPMQIASMNNLVKDNAGADSLMVGLMTLFAGLALGLATLGLYGVIAYSVVQRTREIGIRMALGATKRDVFKLILREGALLVGIGVVLGVPAAIMLPKIIGGVLNGFAPQGPLAVTSAVAAISVIALAAVCIPAFRAMNVDPMGALRSE